MTRAEQRSVAPRRASQRSGPSHLPFLAALLAAIWALGATTASAVQVTWYANSIALADGGRVDGTFVWDSMTNEAVSWELQTSRTENTVFFGQRYSNTLPGHASFFGDLTGLLVFKQAPGTVASRAWELRFNIVDPDRLDTPVDALPLWPIVAYGPGVTECRACDPFRESEPDQVLSALPGTDPPPAPVPLPAAGWMLIAAIAGLGACGGAGRAKTRVSVGPDNWGGSGEAVDGKRVNREGSRQCV